MLYRFQLAYRFQDNSVCGFVDGRDGPDGENAKQGCIKQVKLACEMRGEAYDEKRLILTKGSTTAAEMKTIENDWRLGRGKGIMATRKDLLG